MKLRIYLAPSAHKRIAKGESTYSWDYIVRVAYPDGTWAKDLEHHTFLLETDVMLPSPDEAIHIALAELKAQEQKIQADAHVAVREVQEERAKLLSLTYSTTATEAFDDLPF